jgi:Fic family protein
MYVRKEAVLSSQIECTQSSLSDLLLFESAGTLAAPISDVEEISRYLRAMNHGIRRLEQHPLPTCTRSITLTPSFRAKRKRVSPWSRVQSRVQ